MPGLSDLLDGAGVRMPGGGVWVAWCCCFFWGGRGLAPFFGGCSKGIEVFFGGEQCLKVYHGF